ncbi:hypothetical protein, partial [Cloacibacillus evryensis]|uniref:hypothetical protein n=1 Tax=Cloacibacillus evryensis TaxID=508460 RepID=UPI003AB8216F
IGSYDYLFYWTYAKKNTIIYRKPLVKYVFYGRCCRPSVSRGTAYLAGRAKAMSCRTYSVDR